MRRRSKRDLLATALARTGAARGLRALGAWHGVVGLNYHRIGDADATTFDPGVFSATQEAFDGHVAFLKRNFDIVRPDEIGPGLHPRGRHVLITFDDGYRDNFELAYPVLRAHGVSATFFVTTGFLGRARVSWWDEIAWMVRTSERDVLPAGGPLPAPLDLRDRSAARREVLRRFKALPGDRTEPFLDGLARATGTGRCPPDEADGIWMTWDMAREMRDGGMVFGGHTVDHAVMSGLPHDQQERQIRGCADALRAQLGEPMRWFSYPVGLPGSYDEHTRACLRAVGVEIAFTGRGGFEQVTGFDPLDFRRTNVTLATSPPLVEATTTLPQLFARD
jgi:peptidoglycan/xylan/chitin deacetylase (PgdA/CDA1 family)